MPRDSRGGHGKSKPELITEVLAEDPGRPTSKVQTAVWTRFGEAVTPREIAQARRRLRAAAAGPAAPAEPTPATQPAAARVRKRRASEAAPAPPAPAKPARRSRPAARPADDPAAAEVTVAQLSAILAAAEEVGGLDHLREAVRVVRLVRERAGGVDDRQLAFALDFLARLTGGGR